MSHERATPIERNGSHRPVASPTSPTRDRRPIVARAGVREAGLSLIELVVAIVVISISLSGVLLVVDTTTRASADPMLERQAISIADAYLEEILQKAYLDPDTGTLCPAPEATRSLFDNLCDYDGLDETGARDQHGNAVAGLEAYRVRIAIDRSAALGTVSGESDVVRVDASVNDPMGRLVRMSGYRTNY